MRLAAFNSWRLLALGAVLSGSWLTANPAWADNDDAAHALAQKFSGSGEEGEAKAPGAVPSSPVQDAQQTEQVQVEAAKKAADDQKRAAAKSAEAKRRATDAKLKAEAARRATQEQMKADEADMLARARAEAAERVAEEQRLEAERSLAEARLREEQAKQVAAAKTAEVAKAAETTRLAREAEETARREAASKAEFAATQADAAKADANRRSQEALREDEARRLAEKLRAVRETRGAPEPADAPALTNEPNSKTAEIAPRPEPVYRVGVGTAGASNGDSKVTVLLILQPGTRGIRRFNKLADPVLCVGSDCYVSAGAGAPAERMGMLQALGASNTLGKRAGTCRNKLACAFRQVEIKGTSATIQPVDLHILHHDRREPLAARPDETCDVTSGRLYCGAPLNASDYRAWLVPEHIAAKAGAKALEAALADGLPPTRSAALRDR